MAEVAAAAPAGAAAQAASRADAAAQEVPAAAPVAAAEREVVAAVLDAAAAEVWLPRPLRWLLLLLMFALWRLRDQEPGLGRRRLDRFNDHS